MYTKLVEYLINTENKLDRKVVLKPANKLLKDIRLVALRN